MRRDDELLLALLSKLAGRERALASGASVLVQPQIEGLYVENPLSVPGYDHEQIDFHLRLLCQLRLIDTGGPAADVAAIGIYFSRITESGRSFMSAELALKQSARRVDNPFAKTREGRSHYSKDATTAGSTPHLS
jgi:hypothetical protein